MSATVINMSPPLPPSKKRKLFLSNLYWNKIRIKYRVLFSIIQKKNLRDKDLVLFYEVIVYTWNSMRDVNQLIVCIIEKGTPRSKRNLQTLVPAPIHNEAAACPVRYIATSHSRPLKSRGLLLWRQSPELHN